jgi:hypothetical protein
VSPLSILAVFIEWPLLAIVPAALFAFAYMRCRRPVVLVASLAWLAYCPYEYAMKLRILCSGECNIRVDLLLLYPLLLVLSIAAAYVFIKHPRNPNRDQPFRHSKREIR